MEILRIQKQQIFKSIAVADAISGNDALLVEESRGCAYNVVFNPLPRFHLPLRRFDKKILRRSMNDKAG